MLKIRGVKAEAKRAARVVTARLLQGRKLAAWIRTNSNKRKMLVLTNTHYLFLKPLYACEAEALAMPEPPFDCISLKCHALSEVDTDSNKNVFVVNRRAVFSARKSELELMSYHTRQEDGFEVEHVFSIESLYRPFLLTNCKSYALFLNDERASSLGVARELDGLANFAKKGFMYIIAPKIPMNDEIEREREHKHKMIMAAKMKRRQEREKVEA